MRYQGGKERVAKYIVKELPDYIDVYIEPFIGGLSIASRIKANQYVLADGLQCVPFLYHACYYDGWIPPTSLTIEEYKWVKAEVPQTDPLHAFVGFGCSFGGKYWGGYSKTAREDKKERPYCEQAHNSLLRKINRLKANANGSPVTFLHSDYQDLEIPDGAVVYCDPPYAGTTAYAVDFDSDQFWQWAQDLSKRCKVFVSEYKAPEGWYSIWQREKAVDIKRGERSFATENLFFYWG